MFDSLTLSYTVKPSLIRYRERNVDIIVIVPTIGKIKRLTTPISIPPFATISDISPPLDVERCNFFGSIIFTSYRINNFVLWLYRLIIALFDKFMFEVTDDF